MVRFLLLPVSLGGGFRIDCDVIGLITCELRTATRVGSITDLVTLSLLLLSMDSFSFCLTLFTGSSDDFGWSGSGVAFVKRSRCCFEIVVTFGTILTKLVPFSASVAVTTGCASLTSIGVADLIRREMGLIVCFRSFRFLHITVRVLVDPADVSPVLLDSVTTPPLRVKHTSSGWAEVVASETVAIQRYRQSS